MDLEHQHQRLHHIWSIGDATHLSYSLPPANEVWGKVMFLHLFVSLFTEKGVGFPACIPGDMTRRGLHRGGEGGGWWFPSMQHMSHDGGVSIQGRWVDPHPKIHGNTVNKRAVCILLECILVWFIKKSKLFNERNIASHITALMLTLCVNGFLSIQSL